MKLLAIGNSFSQDATHYLMQIAKADGVELEVSNLYIGGCSLEMHWENIENNAQDYLLEVNGISTDRYVTIQESVLSDSWDYIVTQQASHDSGLKETYHPYLEHIIEYLKKMCPNAKLLLQQTWAYELDSLHQGFLNYHQDQLEMYQCLKAAYEEAATMNGISLIRCGDVIQELRKEKMFSYGHGGMSICRDGFHMNIIYGRYLLAAVWYRTLTGKEIGRNNYKPSTNLAPNAICDETVLQVIKNTVDRCVK